MNPFTEGVLVGTCIWIIAACVTYIAQVLARRSDK